MVSIAAMLSAHAVQLLLHCPDILDELLDHTRNNTGGSILRALLQLEEDHRQTVAPAGAQRSVHRSR